MKNIWILNQYGSLPSTGIGGRHRHLSRELVELGFKVTLVSARWTHGTRDENAADNAPELEKFEGFQFLRIPVRKYKHAHDKKRVLNWFSFAWRTRNLRERLGEKPDVIIYSSPSLIGYLTAYRLAKKNKAKLIFEIRDIWPLTLILMGGFSKRHPFIKFMQWIEDFAYKKSDFVISNLEGAAEHAESRGLDPSNFFWIPNGFSKNELEEVDSDKLNIIDAIKEQPFSVTYTGAVGEANSLDTMIEAANLLKDKSSIHFNIVGRGRLYGHLQSKSSELGLDNVHFWGSVNKNQVQPVLQVSSVCGMFQKNMELYRYGVAANKMFDYLYCGRPVINSYSGGYDVISRYRSGVTVPAEDPQALADGIINLSKVSPEALTEMGSNGKKAVVEDHEYQKIALKLKSVLMSERVVDG